MCNLKTINQTLLFLKGFLFVLVFLFLLPILVLAGGGGDGDSGDSGSSGGGDTYRVEMPDGSVHTGLTHEQAMSVVSSGGYDSYTAVDGDSSQSGVSTSQSESESFGNLSSGGGGGGVINSSSQFTPPNYLAPISIVNGIPPGYTRVDSVGHAGEIFDVYQAPSRAASGPPSRSNPGGAQGGSPTFVGVARAGDNDNSYGDGGGSPGGNPGCRPNCGPGGGTSPWGWVRATPCSIALNESTCVSTVTWDSLNIPDTQRIIVQIGSTREAVSTDAENLVGVSRTVSFTNRTFAIYNGSTELDSISAIVSCEVGEEIDGVCQCQAGQEANASSTSCVQTPVVTIDLSAGSANLVRRGNTVELLWVADTTVDLTCSIVGSADPDLTFTASATNTSGSVTSRNINNQTEFTIRCVNETAFPGREFTDEVTVQVIPSIIEI